MIGSAACTACCCEGEVRERQVRGAPWMIGLGRSPVIAVRQGHCGVLECVLRALARHAAGGGLCAGGRARAAAAAAGRGGRLLPQRGQGGAGAGAMAPGAGVARRRRPRGCRGLRGGGAPALWQRPRVWTGSACTLHGVLCVLDAAVCLQPGQAHAAALLSRRDGLAARALRGRGCGADRLLLLAAGWALGEALGADAGAEAGGRAAREAAAGDAAATAAGGLLASMLKVRLPAAAARAGRLWHSRRWPRITLLTDKPLPS
jgi:hypothetical protein